MKQRSIRVKAPASSGNLGAGFDCVGMALDWYGEFEFVMDDSPQESQSTDGVSSSIIASMGERAFAASLAELGITTETISVSFRGEIPVGSGLGTSAMARAAGITAAAHLAQRPEMRDELIDIGLALEGHGDNLYPAMYGGIHVVSSDPLADALLDLPLSGPRDLEIVLLIPDFTMPTDESRKLLPERVTVSDAVHNMSRVGFLIGALYEGRYDLLRHAFDDVLHQPARSKIFPAMYPLIHAAQSAGAYGAYLSGGGSTIAAVVQKGQSKSVLIALEDCANEWNLSFTSHVCTIGSKGTYVVSDTGK